MPESASFSVRPKPNYRRRRTFTVLVLLAVAVIVVALLSRGGGGTKKGEPGTPTMAFASTVTNVPQQKAPDAGTATANGDAVVKMFNDYYQVGFVDPHKWGDGTFKDLQALFVKEANTSFTGDINSLTIGEARTELKRVDPQPSTLTVTVYYDAAAKPTFAVAAATFVATGTLKQAGPALIIQQKATYYLQKFGDAWTIISYDAHQTQQTPTPSPSPSS